MKQRTPTKSKPVVHVSNGDDHGNGTQQVLHVEPNKYSGRSGQQLSATTLLAIGAFIGISCFALFFEDSCSSLDPFVGLVLPASTQADNSIVVKIDEPPTYYGDQPDIKLKSSKKLFREMPKKYRRNFYSHGSRICQPMIRALRDLGWTKVENKEEARFLYTYTRYTSWYQQLESWQRYNHVPETYHWNRKDNFIEGIHNWEKKNKDDAWFVPATYRLHEKDEKKEFQDVLFNQGGIDYPWVLKKPNVNQGKGITFLGPNSDELKHVTDEIPENLIIQQYVCNEMIWGKRKFDVRMYWLVASLDPLIAFYQDGYARIGNADYDETDFSNTRAHLTTHTFLGEEGKGSMDDLGVEVTRIWNSDPELQKRIKDPVTHVRNQFKHALAVVVDSFKGDGLSFTTEHLKPEDSFEFYGADFVLDNDLDVWLIEPQDDTGMDEDHYFRLEMHHNIFYGMGMVLGEIWDKQASGKPILPIKNTGMWEIINAGDWMYEYEGYERSADKKSCEVKK